MTTNDQGTMTSPSLNAMLVSSIVERYPEIDVDGLEKVELLRAVMKAHGWRSVFELGHAVRGLTWHPVVQSLVACSDPATIVRRWMSLERFGHSRNRISLAACDGDEAATTLTLRHFAPGGGTIVAVNDLFVWGLIVGLLEAAAVTGIEAALILPGAEPFVLHGQAVASATAPLPPTTDRLKVIGYAPTASSHPSSVPEKRADDSARERLAALVRRDLLHRWTVADASRALALSPRSLQRTLHHEGTTFSEAIQRARVEVGQSLLKDSRLTLTEIAFCVGFADQSHFTRTFRRFYDVPPSVFRDMAASTGPRP
jgi:AraC-like DNA-binding protein